MKRLGLSSQKIDNEHGIQETGTAKKLLGFTGADVFLAIVFGVVGLPAVWRWIGWFLCLLTFVYLLTTMTSLAKRPLRLKVLLTVLVSITFWVASNSAALSQWQKERSTAKEGHLRPAHDTRHPNGSSLEGVVMTVGPVTGSDHHPTMITLTGEGKHQTPAGSDLLIDRKNGVLTLSTEIHDRDGDLVAEVVDNEWKVYPNFVSDVNYSSNSIEVKDRRGKIVLKAAIFDDYIQVEAEWWHEGGVGIRMVRPYPYDPDKSGPVFVAQFRPGYMNDEPRIVEMFKYPSDVHFGELVDSLSYWYDSVFLFRAVRF